MKLLFKMGLCTLWGIFLIGEAHAEAIVGSKYQNAITMYSRSKFDTRHTNDMSFACKGELLEQWLNTYDIEAMKQVPSARSAVSERTMAFSIVGMIHEKDYPMFEDLRGPEFIGFIRRSIKEFTKQGKIFKPINGVTWDNFQDASFEASLEGCDSFEFVEFIEKEFGKLTPEQLEKEVTVNVPTKESLTEQLKAVASLEVEILSNNRPKGNFAGLVSVSCSTSTVYPNKIVREKRTEKYGTWLKKMVAGIE